jgi:hypothetical protein
MQSRISAGGNAPDRSVVVGGTLKLLQVAARICPSIIDFEVIFDLTPAAPGVVVPHDPADHQFVDLQPADVQLAGAPALESKATDCETPGGDSADGHSPEGHGAHGKRPQCRGPPVCRMTARVRVGAASTGVVSLGWGCSARSERTAVLRMAMAPTVRAASTTAPMASAPTEAAPPECRVTARVRTAAPGVGVVSLGSGCSALSASISHLHDDPVTPETGKRR